MRLPHNLIRHPSGVFHFRLRVPPDLYGSVSVKVIKRSLRTRCPRTAQAWAYVLTARYHAAFITLRSGTMPKPNLNDLLNLDTSSTQPYEISSTPGGGFAVKADGAEDHARAMEALKALAATPFPTAAPAPTVPVVKRSGLTLAKAHRAWIQFITPSTIRKTLSIKSTAIGAFAKHVGLTKSIEDVTRTDVADWVQALRNEGLSTPTIVNKLSYLKGFFEWAKGAGHYTGSDNPATGQLTYTHREKRQRRKHGFKPLTADQVGVLYKADALLGLSEAARWGAVLGIYTGARVAEVGQLTLADFVAVDGVPCVRFTDEGEGQSLKTDASIRTVPLHSDLLALGVLERVDALREQGESRFFPSVKVDGVNGMGNWLSKAFTRHLTACKVSAGGVGKVGFHSLRKTVIQAMQTAGVSSEHRAQFVGHDLDDEHHAAYSRDYTPAEQLAVIGPALSWSIDLPAIRTTLTTTKTARKSS